MTSAHLIDEKTHGAKFIERVATKARKRAFLPPEHANTPFVVALASDEPELRPITVLSELTGPRGFTRTAAAAPKVARFERVRVGGWEPLLHEWQYVGTTRARFSSYGAFGGDPITWAKDVSGVLVLHDSDTLLQWLPNPFATEAIASPRLLGLGLSVAMLGAASPEVAD